MKIFKRTSNDGWGNRLNVVDENNVFVGFDFEQHCCERFGYYLTKDLIKPDECTIAEESFDHSGYVFDITFCRHFNIGDEYDQGGATAFKLTKPQSPDIFLVLYNHHNGYYSHGFDMFVGDKKQTVHSGSI